MTGPDRRDLGRVFDEVPELYDRVRPAYPDELFADLVAITGMDRRSPVLEVGWWPHRRGTGSTRPSAGAGRMTCSIPGDGWRCSATLLSAGRVSRRYTPRPPICMSDFPPATPAGVILRSRTRCG